MKFPKRRGQFRNEKLSYSSCTKKKKPYAVLTPKTVQEKAKKKKPQLYKFRVRRFSENVSAVGL